MLHCLWLSAELPQAPRTGLHRYSAGLREGLVEAGVELEVIGLGRPDPLDDDRNPRRWPVPGELRGGVRSLTSRLPNVAFACEQPLLRSVEHQLARRPWDAVIVDHLQTAWAVPRIAARPGRRPVTAFITHNHEERVRREIARSHRALGLRGAILRLDARKAARLERRAVAAADLVTSITAEDATSLSREGRRERLVVLPPGYHDPRVAPTPSRERRREVVVLGSYDWHVKAENLRTFLAVADPLLHAAGITLTVIGAVPDALRSDPAGRSATRFAGWVPSIAAALQSARIGIVAEPQGGGFKMKCLDYLFHHVPIAAVRGTAAGLGLTGGEQFIEAADSAQLCRRIVDLIDQSERLDAMARSAYRLACGRFDWRASGRLLADALGNAQAARSGVDHARAAITSGGVPTPQR